MKLPPIPITAEQPGKVLHGPIPGWVYVLVVFGVTLLAYAPAMRGQYIWDDDAHITRPELRSLNGLWRIWFDISATQQYYPLVHSTFWVEHKLWGDRTILYHLVNVLLHSTSACVLVLILRRLSLPGAYLAGLIFALHPVHVESVAWITELKNTLSGLFYLLSALCYLRFDSNRRPRNYLCATALFVAALLCKTVTSSLPAALLLIFWWKRGRVSWRKDVVPLLPWFCIGITTGLLTAWVERRLIGAEGPGFDLTLLERFLLASRAVLFYASKLLWPSGLTFMYPKWQISSAYAWQYIYPASLIAIVALLFLIRRKTRGPLAAWLFFVGTLFPALGFLNVAPFMYSYVADHFQYLASIGIIALGAAAVTVGASRASSNLTWIASSFLVLLLASLTWRQAHAYSDPETLYRQTIDRNPHGAFAHNNLGVILLNSGRTSEAIEHFQRAVEVNPSNFESRGNLANTLLAIGMYRSAMENYRLALTSVRVAGSSAEATRNYASILNNLAWIYSAAPDESLRNPAEAVRLARHAVEMTQGQDADTLDTLATSYASSGQFAEAEESAENALAIARAQGREALARDLTSKIAVYQAKQSK